MNYVLDTNVIIYAQKGALKDPLPLGRYFVSVITEIELLSFAGLSAEQEGVLRELLGDVTIIGIESEVKHRAVELRRRHRLRIPDAIIAATTMTLNATLLTNDLTLEQIDGLTCERVQPTHST